MQRLSLIKTAYEHTWPKAGPVLFLGEWCRLYSRREIWSNLEGEVVPYHWDDRKKLYKDYLYLKDIYEKFLEKIALKLNSIHNVNHSTRYWRILVGPWLGYFIQIIFDRWEMLNRAINNYSVDDIRILEAPLESMIPKDMQDFTELFVTDIWNEVVYSELLSDIENLKLIKLPFPEKESQFDSYQTIQPMRKLKRRLAGIISKISNFAVRRDEFFFISTYLPIKYELLLQLRLGQIPRLWRPFSPPEIKPDLSKRKWTLCDYTAEEFERVLDKMIPIHIPALYLEGYPSLLSFCKKLPWPDKPKAIFTSNAENSDDVFKCWAAEKVERGVPLVIGQHGGHYGTGLWSFSEEHEIQISDRYFSWGWEEDTQPKIKAVGQIKAKRPLGIRHALQPYALLVTATVSRYSYWMYSIMVASQWLEYLNDQFRFVENLPQRIQKSIIVRLYSKDYGWDQILRWQNRFPQIRLDSGQTEIDNLIRRSRLYISTYNATTFLESFTMNVPTVIFWNPTHWELRNCALPYFEELKKVGIFHENPESAARHVTDVWDNVDAWWLRHDVQAAREYFCQRYAFLSNDLIGEVEKALRDVVEERKERESQALASKNT